jgi:hypothetical protein
MAGGVEQPKAPSEHAPSKPQAQTGAPATTESDVITGKRDAPIVATDVDDVLKASDVAKERIPAQTAAQNHQHGHLELPHLGLEGSHSISIETGVGQMRRGTDPDGKPWEVRMQVAYGKIKGVTGNDGDNLDIFVGPRPQSSHVFLIDQRDPATDKLDEHKVLAGFDNRKSAVRALIPTQTPRCLASAM